jgi:hypothetical protein
MMLNAAQKIWSGVFLPRFVGNIRAGQDVTLLKATEEERHEHE